MKVWYCGDFADVKIGQKVLVARCGSGRTYFGEFGKLARVTSNSLVFVTDSGATVKTAIDNIHKVYGKAAKAHYFVSLTVDGREDDQNFIRQNVRFWDEKKLCFVNK